MSIQYQVIPPMLSVWSGFNPIPGPAAKIFPKDQKRFYFFCGGRASGKSFSTADFLIERSRQEKCRILCCREVQRSIKESVAKLLEERINALGLDSEFIVQKTEIKNTRTGSEFIFVGLKDHTSDSIKSYQGIKYCWVEEAHAVSEKSLKILIPTIRLESSSILFTYNRYLETDPVHRLMQREIQTAPEPMSMVIGKKTLKWHQAESKNAIYVSMNYDSNPYFPDVLKEEMEQERKASLEGYLHIWEGKPIAQSANAIFTRAEVNAACNREVNGEGGVVIGVDVARMGDDSSIFYKRRGMQVIDFAQYKKTDTHELSNQLEVFADYDKNALIQVDDTGVGGGVTDNMRGRGYHGVRAVVFNQTPLQPDKHDMAISEMWFYLKSVIDEVQLPNDEQLKEELTERRYFFDKRQRRCVESKRDFKKRLGRSPDKADAMLLCFFNFGGGIIEQDFSVNDTSYILRSSRDDRY